MSDIDKLVIALDSVTGERNKLLDQVTVYKINLAASRADLAAARKWAKTWKHKNSYDRMMHEIYKKVSNELVEDLSEARNEIQRLNGRRCDECVKYEKVENPKLPYHACYHSHFSGCCPPGDFYCKGFEKR